MITFFPLFFKIFTPKSIRAITLFPFIILKENIDREDQVLIHHERIHLRQQAELLIILFYAWYIIEYFIRLVIYRNRYEAYRNISFEREAYSHENEESYLKDRKLFAHLKYI